MYSIPAGTAMVNNNLDLPVFSDSLSNSSRSSWNSTSTSSTKVSLSNVSYLHQLSVIVSVPRLAPVPESRVLPVQIESIEVILPQELNCVPHQLSSTVSIRYHGGKPGRALVPTTDGQQRLQVLVVALQPDEFRVTTWRFVVSVLSSLRRFTPHLPFSTSWYLSNGFKVFSFVKPPNA